MANKPQRACFHRSDIIMLDISGNFAIFAVYILLKSERYDNT